MPNPDWGGWWEGVGGGWWEGVVTSSCAARSVMTR
jgi:hypothetical protein